MFEPVMGMSLCTFCHLEFEDSKIKSHEDYCGSRTEECPECGDYVMLKESFSLGNREESGEDNEMAEMLEELFASVVAAIFFSLSSYKQLPTV